MKVVECPRDAMQGIHTFIPTQMKADYINSLLKVGFDTIDFGSFVNPKVMPQMRDTAQLLELLDLSSSDSKLLAIIANVRGANEALEFQQIDYLGYPLSISETFQKRNTNKTISESLKVVSEIHQKCFSSNKQLVVYLSMGFGNPYGDPYNEEILLQFVKKLDKVGVEIISLSDTIGVSEPEQIERVFPPLIDSYPHIEFGAHLHSRKELAKSKIDAVVSSGCKRIDGALLGYGGCPMAKDDLTGNVDTIDILATVEGEYDHKAFAEAKLIANKIFSQYT